MSPKRSHSTLLYLKNHLRTHQIDHTIEMWKQVFSITSFIKWRNARMIRRGEIYYADLSPVKGSEQGGIRPVLIIQNDIGNKFSPTVIVAAVTAKIQKAKLLTHVEVKSSKKGLNKNSVILLEQIRTIDKQRLTDRVTVLDKKVMKEVDNSLKISLSLVTF